ncbi:MAG TPA: hypothetical protein PLT92_04050 [Ignavibacteriaceae bacterium]|nr:hypothetical protein [Ignavibacteriaceae bacterium]
MLFHTNSHGPDEPALIRAFNKCIALSAALNNEFKICLSNKGALKANTIVNVFGVPFTKGLSSNTFRYRNIIVHLETKKITVNNPMPALAIHMDNVFREDIITRNNNENVVYVPWTEHELADYLVQHPSSVSI